MALLSVQEQAARRQSPACVSCIYRGEHLCFRVKQTDMLQRFYQEGRVTRCALREEVRDE